MRLMSGGEMGLRGSSPWIRGEDFGSIRLGSSLPEGPDPRAGFRKETGKVARAILEIGLHARRLREEKTRR